MNQEKRFKDPYCKSLTIKKILFIVMTVSVAPSISDKAM